MQHSVDNRELTILPHPEFDLTEDVEGFWRVLTKVVNDNGGWDKALKVVTEREVILQLGGYQVPGHCDLTLYFPDKIVIFDYKFGGGWVPTPDRNYQLGGYGVAVTQEAIKFFESYKFSEVEVHLLSLGMGHMSYTHNLDEIDDLTDYMHERYDLAHTPDAERCISDECKYCPAIFTSACPETSKSPAVALKIGREPSLMTVPIASKLYSLKDVIDKGMKLAETTLRSHLEAGLTDTRYKLGNAPQYRGVEDNEAFLEALEMRGIAPARKVTFEWGAVDKAVAQEKGLSIAKAKEYLAAEFDIKKTPGKPKIVKRK
jgi:hypothetical protein